MEAAAVVTPPFAAGPLKLAPFRALRLAASRVGDPAASRSFGRPFRDVAARLQRLRDQGHLVHDTTPALYVHEYTAAGLTVRGVVGLVDVSRRATNPEDRAIWPHEGIYPAQADELADRMTQMQVNPAPILLVQRSPAPLRAVVAAITTREPDHAFTDRGGQHHRLWACRDPQQIDALNAAVAGTSALIADGHHRYAAYLRLQQRQPGGAHDHGLAMLVDQGSTPLFLGAIHRGLRETSLADVESAARAIGARLQHGPQSAVIARLGGTTLAVTDAERWASLELPVPPDVAPVEVLHDQLVPALPHGPSRLTYHHTVEDALGQVGPDLGTAVLLPAPDVDLVLRITGAGRLLPQKATSFQPKPHLGVLLRSLHDG